MKLLQQYGLRHIAQVIILSALAIKGFISFIEWGFPRLKGTIQHIDQPAKNAYILKEQVKEINDIKKSINKITKMIETLIESDKDDIKAYITKEHHYFVYQQKWIDDYSLDCIERRFSHYIEQGGNSFIAGLMQELRQLPKKPKDQDLKK